VAYTPEKFFKNQLSNRVFSAFLQTEMVSSAVLASQFRLGSNHTIIPAYRQDLLAHRQLR